MIEVKESNMTFGPFDESHFFHIEQSEFYKSVGKNVKTVEFLFSRDFSAVSFIEAKSSSKKMVGNLVSDNEGFISEISEKFLHSFSLYCAALLGRREHTNEIPEGLLSVEPSRMGIKFFLVISGHREEWLQPIKEALIQKLRPYQRIWNFDVLVINDDRAKKYHLIKS